MRIFVRVSKRKGVNSLPTLAEIKKLEKQRKKLHSNIFFSLTGKSEKEIMKEYFDYARLHGDCEAPKDFFARHGDWELVGQHEKTNGWCGQFKKYMICNRVELHNQSDLNGVSHKGEIFVRKTHFSCNKPQCKVCCFSAWACNEADVISQRIEKASIGYVDADSHKHMGLGLPQHIVASPPQSDWGLAEFQNDKFLAKVQKLLKEVGVIGACSIFHGFRYHNWAEALEKKVQFGWEWSPHVHNIGFIQDGYGKCRTCERTAYKYRTRGGKTVTSHGGYACAECNGFEHRVREANKKSGYIIKVEDERTTIFGTAWYALNHSAIRVTEL
jgi:hypothetical protein